MPRKPLNHPYTLILILALAFCLRAWGLQQQSLSMDELFEIELSKASINEIVEAQDGFPPLYHILLHLWLKVFQTNEAARWLSVLLGCLTVMAFWWMACAVGGEATGLWAGLLLAVSPFHIWYSQEARAYSLYFLEATLALMLFFRALEKDRLRDWLFCGAALLTGLYTHYIFAILILTSLIVLAIERRSFRALKNPFLAYVGLGIAFLPMLSSLAEDLTCQGSNPYKTPFDLAALGYTYFSFLCGYSLGPSIRELHVLSLSSALPNSFPWLLLVGGSTLVLFIQGLRGISNGRLLRRLLVFILVPVLLCGLFTEVFSVGYKVQYFIGALVPLLLILGIGLGRFIHAWPTRFAFVLLCILFAISLGNRRYERCYQVEDARGLAAYLASRSKDTPRVFVMSDYMVGPVRYYLGEGWRVLPIPRVSAKGENLDRSLRYMSERVKDSSPYWLVYTRAFHGDPRGLFRQALLQKGAIKHEIDFAGIVLYRGISWKDWDVLDSVRSSGMQ